MYSSTRIPEKILNLAMTRALCVLKVMGIVAVGVLMAPGASFGQKGLEDKLKDPSYWSSLCYLQTDAGKLEEAKASCEQVITLRPKNALAWADHSGVLLLMKQYPEAIASADKALKLESKTSLALTYKCMAWNALSKYEEGLDACNLALKVDGSWGRKSPKLAWLHRGIILTQRNQYEQAMIAYERTLLLEPGDSLTLAYRCQVYNKLEQYQAAINSCNEALAGNGDWGDMSKTFAISNRAEARYQLKQLEASVRDYDELLAIEANDAIAWARQGIILEKLSRPTEALTSYDRAIAINPKYSFAQVGRCTVLNKLEQYKDAEAACGEAIKGDGIWQIRGAAQAWNELGEAQAGQSQHEKALASLQRAVGMKPNYAEAWSNRSVTLWHLQKYDEALQSTQKALTLNPNYAQAWFNRATILTKKQQYIPALLAYDRALRFEPNNHEIWTSRSVVQWEMKKYKEALISLDKARDAT